MKLQTECNICGEYTDNVCPNCGQVICPQCLIKTPSCGIELEEM